jgi:hypothetical protein
MRRWFALGLLVVGSGCASRGLGAEPLVGAGPGSLAPQAAPTYAAQLFLPGTRGAQEVFVQVVDGMAIHQGDILLGPVSQVGARYGRPRTDTTVFRATAVSDESYLWPGGVVPYTFDGSLSAQDRSRLTAAIERLNQTELTLRPATSADRDSVLFVSHGRGCYSYYGRVGGEQDCHVGGCSTATMMHEILHAVGFYHEHARPDRDQYVTVMWDDIYEGEKSNFDIQETALTFGAYDFASVMHYQATSHSRTGRPTLVPKGPAVKVGGATDLSDGDLAGIRALYGNGSPPVVSPPGPQPPGPQPPGPQPGPGVPGTGAPGTGAPGTSGGPFGPFPSLTDLLGLPANGGPAGQGAAWPTLPGLPALPLPSGLPGVPVPAGNAAPGAWPFPRFPW